MRRLSLLLLLFAPAALPGQTKDGFVPLLNGKDLTGWEVRGSKADEDKWSVKDNLLVAKPGGGWKTSGSGSFNSIGDGGG